MAEKSDHIRSEIERTRAEMGDTIEAIGYKADVPERAKEWVADKKDAIVSSVSGKREAVVSTVGDNTPDAAELRQRFHAVKLTAERNPLGLAVAGAAAGFLAGLFAPSTRIEDERLGPVADEIKSAAADAAGEAVERGTGVARDAARAAGETALERGQEEGRELAATLREKAAEAAPGGSTTAGAQSSAGELDETTELRR
jgi:hypothetical protein